MGNVEALPLLLKQLKLSCIYQKWQEQEVLAQEKNWRHAEYLRKLCEFESAQRYANRVRRHTKESKLPPGKTLATFDFTAAKSIKQRQIEALCEDAGWARQGDNVIIFGPSGVGKTHLAAAIGHSLIAQGIRVLFMQTTQLVQKLQEARRQYKLPEMLAKLGHYPLLILDDIGYVKKDEAETGVLFELIADRYEHSSLIITANQPFSDWDKIFADNMMAVAAVDRLVHHATVITIKEESYRKAASLGGRCVNQSSGN